MATIIAEYYTAELADWNDSITFYGDEMDELEEKLEEVIRRNSIVGIAAKVEAHQSILNQASEKFYRLQIELKQQEEILKTNSTYIDDTLINDATEKRQAELRRRMQAIEKEYIDVKFDCYNFLSGTLKKKNN